MSWLRHIVTTSPTEEPVTLSDVKSHCRISGALDDTALGAYLKAARFNVEERCGAKLITQTLKLQCSDWSDFDNFLIWPLISVASIKYLDQNNVEQTLANTVYQAVAGRTPSIYLKPSQSWPAHLCVPDAIRVVADFGFGDATKVPDSIKLAMYLFIGGWNENRESVGPNTLAMVPNGVEALLSDYGFVI